MKAVVLEDWNRFFSGVPSLERLRKRIAVEVQDDRPVDAHDLLARLAGAEIVVLNRERTPFGAAVIDALPSLRLIVQTGGVGPNVDVAAATARGVAVSAGPGLPNSIDGVAELALGLLLSLARKIPENDRNVRVGRWSVAPTYMLNGKTMGIVGLGRLGRSLARLGQALQMPVIAAGPTLTPERAAASGVEFASLDDLFARAVGQFQLERIEVSSSTTGLSVYADAMLEKVFYNLIDNTLRHGGKVSRISLEYEELPDRLALIYRDDGVGIAGKDKPLIFLRSFGANNGLGLFLVREVLAISCTYLNIFTPNP
jgi:hypothetical protein